MLPALSILDHVQTSPVSTICGALGLLAIAGALRSASLLDQQPLCKSEVGSHDPPFPKSTRRIVSNTLDLIKNDPRLYDWLTELCLEFNGQPFRIEAFGMSQTVMLTSPQHIEEVLKTHFDHFEKGPFINEVLQDLLGKGIFASDGETWHHQRKTASQLFTMRTLRDTTTSMVHKHLAGLVAVFDASYTNGTAFDLSAQLHDFTLQTFTDMALGVDLSSPSEQKDPRMRAFPVAFDAAVRRLSARMTVPRGVWKFQRYWNLAGEAALKRNIQVVHSTAVDIIAKSLMKRQQGDTMGERLNLVSLFLDSFERDDVAFDPTYLRDIVLNILFAGRDTTAQTLSWFFYCLSENPHATRKIREEIARHAPELLDQSTTGFAMEQVAKLSYLDAAIKETLRLYPSVPLNIRTTMQDTLLSDGTLLRKGMLVGFPTYAQGRMPHVWGPNATVYDPDRWFDAATGKPLVVSSFQFSAFHGGPRQCLGQQLAMLEMKIVATALLTRFDITVEPGQTVTYARSLTLAMKNPFRVTATRRT